MSLNLNYFGNKKEFRARGITVKEGEPILKIVCDKNDIYEAKNGQIHLDIFGMKLDTLKSILK